MTTPATLEPAELDRLSRRAHTLATEVDQLGAQLYAMSQAAAWVASAPQPSTTAPVGTTTSTTAQASAPIAPPTMAPSARPTGQSPPAAYAGTTKTAPIAQPTMSTGPTPPRAPIGVPPETATTTPWYQRDGIVSRILAVGGVAITLAGVVMLLVMAAQAGLLRPEVRVLMGAVLASGLVGAGYWVRRRPGGQVGAIALAATGVVAGFLDILAMTSLYHFVSPPVGLALSGVVAAVGVVTAVRWDASRLAVLVHLAVALTAPFITLDALRTLVLFYVLLQVAGAALELTRGWSSIAPFRTTPVVLATMILIGTDMARSFLTSDPARPDVWTLSIAVAVAVIGVGVMAWGASIQRHPVVAALAGGVATTPALVATLLSPRPVAVTVSLVLAAAALGTALLTARTARGARAVEVTVSAFFVLVACTAVRPDDPTLLPVAFLAVALVAGAVALQTGSRYARWYAVAYGILSTVVMLSVISPDVLADRALAVQRLTFGAVLDGLLLAGVAALATVGWARSRWADRAPGLMIPVILAGLYATTVLAVALPVSIGHSEESFLLGHLLATTMWALAGGAALLVGLARPAWARALLAIGLTLIGAAVAKLVLFDLANLSGVTRVVAFLVTGILLLVVGTRYARSFADRSQQPAPSDEPTVGAQPEPADDAGRDVTPDSAAHTAPKH